MLKKNILSLPSGLSHTAKVAGYRTGMEETSSITRVACNMFLQNINNHTSIYKVL
jgi:hypothetical protein